MPRQPVNASPSIPMLDELTFESILDAAPDAMIGVDATGTIRFVNRQTDVMFGFDRRDLVGRPIETLLPEAWRDVHPTHRDGYVADPQTRTMGAGLKPSGRRKDGTKFPIDISLSSIEIEDRLLVIAAVRDMSERRTVDSNFETLLDAAPDAMVGLDQSGTIRLANRQIEVLFGYGQEELVGRPMQMLVPEILRDSDPSHRYDNLVDPGRRAEGAGAHLTGRRRDGTEFPVDVRLSSIGSDNGLLVTAVIRDDTDRRRVEQDLQRMAAIIEFSDDAVIGKSLDGVIRSWNPAAERLYGYSEAEAVGQPVSMLIPPGHEDDVASILGRVARGERVEHYETVRVSRDGRVIDVSVSASPIRDLNGVLIGASTIARDITDRTRAEAMVRELNVELENRVVARTAELAEAVEQLEGFSYSVSHDLRAPLRAIDGFSRILQEEYGEKFDAEGQRLLNIIRGATTEMSRLIDDLLAFSRVGRREIDREFIDMGELVTSVINELAPSYANRDLRMVIGALPPTQGDRALIRQVLVNLLSNAIKFTATREHAQIEIGGTVEPGRNVYWVKDNGVGFDKAYEEKMFQVFQRLHAAEFEGTGVGLAIVQRIVRRHGGRVWADGEVGEGATIYVALANTNGMTP